MRSTSVRALLFAAYACAAQPQLSAGQLRASLLPGNLLRIGAGQQQLISTATICLETDPNPLIVRAAEKLASQMFAAIRVRLQWNEPLVCPAGATDPIFLMLQTRTPEAQFPGALGVALPLEGSHAWVFYDRVLRISAMRWGPDDYHAAGVLAHVMAHEIAHSLQGTIRHSEAGILKASWGDSDYTRMARFPLMMFTREDAILIHRGLEERRARLLSNASAGFGASHLGEISAGERSLVVP